MILLLCNLVFPPYHLIHNPGVALDDFDHLGRDIFLHVVRHGDAVVAILVHLHGGVHGLEEAVRVDACQDKATFVQSLRALGGGADAHRRERVPHAGKETALLGQGAAVADHGEGVHLQAVVVVETQRLMLDHPLVQLETGLLQTLFAAGMAAVQHGHVVLFRHLVDGSKKAHEIILRVDVLRQVTAGVLRIAQVHVGNNVHDAAVGLLRQALVLAAVAGFHMEDGDVQTLRCNGGQTAVGFSQGQQRVRLNLSHQLVGFICIKSLLIWQKMTIFIFFSNTL